MDASVAPRSRLSRDARIEQTLAVARELFAERGYAAVTMDEVAAAVGVTKPLLYNYFGNKEQLYIACMERAGRRADRDGRDAVAASASPGDALRRRRPRLLRLPRLRPRRLGGALRRDPARTAARSPSAWPTYRGRILELVSASMLAQLPARSRRRREDRNRGALDRPARRRRGAGALVAAQRGAQRRRRCRAADLDRRARPARPLRRLPHRPAQPKGNEPQMNSKTRRVAVLGGNRIPFARSDSAYAHASNQDMLTAALDGLVDRFGLQGERLGEVAGGAVLKHSRDFDLDPRERARHQARRRRPPPTTSSRPAGPAWRRRSWSPTRSPSARSTPASPAASTPPPTRRSRSTRTCARSCWRPTASARPPASCRR